MPKGTDIKANRLARLIRLSEISPGMRGQNITIETPTSWVSVRVNSVVFKEIQCGNPLCRRPVSPTRADQEYCSGKCCMQALRIRRATKGLEHE